MKQHTATVGVFAIVMTLALMRFAMDMTLTYVHVLSCVAGVFAAEYLSWRKND